MCMLRAKCHLLQAREVRDDNNILAVNVALEDGSILLHPAAQATLSWLPQRSADMHGRHECSLESDMPAPARSRLHAHRSCAHRKWLRFISAVSPMKGIQNSPSGSGSSSKGVAVPACGSGHCTGSLAVAGAAPACTSRLCARICCAMALDVWAVWAAWARGTLQRRSPACSVAYVKADEDAKYIKPSITTPASVSQYCNVSICGACGLLQKQGMAGTYDFCTF